MQLLLLSRAIRKDVLVTSIVDEIETLAPNSDLLRMSAEYCFQA
jgi:hypothetical protein